MNLFYLSDIAFCGSSFKEVWTIFGYVIFGIQIVVPLLLIVFGMLTMAKAVMEDDEKKIKAAQDLLVKRLITAALAFLIIFIVKLLVSLVGPKNWDGCVKCALNPFAKDFTIETANGKETYSCGFEDDIRVEVR